MRLLTRPNLCQHERVLTDVWRLLTRLCLSTRPARLLTRVGVLTRLTRLPTCIGVLTRQKAYVGNHC